MSYEVEEIKIGDKKTLKELYNCDALTMEGLRKDSIDDFVGWMEDHNIIPENDVVYTISGDVMNKEYGLTGDNAYPNDLTIVSVPWKVKDKEKPTDIIMARFQIGARWFSDVIDNNLMRQKEK